MPFLEQIRLANLLSFGPETEPLDLRDLNVLIGPNGSGKSNLLGAIDILRNAPSDVTRPFVRGGIREWLQDDDAPAVIDVVLKHPDHRTGLRYVISFSEQSHRFRLVDERIEYSEPDNRPGIDRPYFFYQNRGGDPVLNVADGQRRLKRESVDLNRSILAQRRDPDIYPELTWLAQSLAEVRLYRDWTFGPDAKVRLPQRTDLPNDRLEPDASNLFPVWNRLAQKLPVKRRLLSAIQNLFDGIVDFSFRVEGGTIGLLLHEGDVTIPASRLSDGTLRWMSLLAILCDPEASGLICIEEPELGLHPDIIPMVRDLLHEASERCQLLVTTHSELLVDAMTDRPESVVICDKTQGRTRLRRLLKTDLEPWLEDEDRLGELWTRGQLGGVRW